MPSNYQTFDVTVRKADGSTVYLANRTVLVHNATTNVSLGTLTTNSEGIIPAGSLNVPAGTRVQFRIENYQGLAGSIVQITT